MSDVGSIHATLSEPRFLKGKDAQKPVDVSSHLTYTVFAPRPSLGGDQVDHGDANLLQFPRETKVEVGAIRENRKRGPAFHSSPDQLSKLTVNVGNVRDHLCQAHHRKTGCVYHRFHAGSLHTRSGAAEEPEIRPYFG